MCVVDARVAAEQLVGTFAAEQYRGMLAGTPSQQPQGQRVGMADRLIHVPAGDIQRADECGLIEHKTVAIDARRGRCREDPSLFRELRLVEDDREGVQISAVM